ncbi:MAG: hypothetical protein OI717_00545 (plasmid) [Candidatus Methanoperedens sp.]|nr:MAG: hypothetical protein OI717_00545 [Candidatus Methanoperedens sp.]
MVDQTANERTIKTFAQHYLDGAGDATPDPSGCAGSGGFIMLIIGCTLSVQTILAQIIK